MKAKRKSRSAPHSSRHQAETPAAPPAEARPEPGKAGRAVPRRIANASVLAPETPVTPKARPAPGLGAAGQPTPKRPRRDLAGSASPDAPPAPAALSKPAEAATPQPLAPEPNAPREKAPNRPAPVAPAPAPSPARPQDRPVEPGPNASVAADGAAARASAPPPPKSQPNAPKEEPKAAQPDWDRLARNMGLLVEETGKAASAFLKPRDARATAASVGGDVSDLFKTLGQVAGHWMSDPGRIVQAQAAWSGQFVDLWSEGLRRLSGGPPPPEEAKPADKRFAAPEWRQNPVFDFMRQAYLMTTDWASSMVDDADTLDPQTRDKARFYLRQVSSALSPSNFLATNPELLRETFDQSGENLVRGMRMLAEDIEAGKGELKIRQSDPSPFKLGVNMAVTPGKVVFRNDLMELIQYAPTTTEVLRRPLLIVPPWINKFYVLDLNPQKSFVRWAVEQGLTVFVISWVNPDERHADKGFEAYMREGILAALDAVEQATGERDATAIGYCVGGTLLAITLAYLAAKGERPISSATFFTAQVDFRDAGDLKVFADEEQIQALEAQMAETGYLKGSKMANAFNMLRPNELIWSFVVNNYLKGKAPMAFDLLAWNSDSTRMPAANHAFYLRNCYLGNKLTKGEMVIGGEPLDLRRVEIPVYNLATREDHIAPARSVFTGAKFFGGPVRYVLAGSGHIAGVVNPPAKPKYQFWAGPPVEGTLEEWLARATEHPGSWWPDWLAWISAQAPDKVAARVPGTGKLAALCDAPGEYVRVQS